MSQTYDPNEPGHGYPTRPVYASGPGYGGTGYPGGPGYGTGYNLAAAPPPPPRRNHKRGLAITGVVALRPAPPWAA